MLHTKLELKASFPGNETKKIQKVFLNGKRQTDNKYYNKNKDPKQSVLD